MIVALVSTTNVKQRIKELWYMIMNQEKLLHDVISLPQFAQQEVIDFIAFMNLRYGNVSEKNNENLPDIETEPFIGMWRNRDDMNDSRDWVRNLRMNEWSSCRVD